MKKAAIITICSDKYIYNFNYGNRLQNYAVQEILKKNNIISTTILNVGTLDSNNYFLLRYMKLMMLKIKYILNKNKKTMEIKREKNFSIFDQNISFTKKYFNFMQKQKYTDYDYYIVGSDQVWNPLGLSDFGFLPFIKDDNKKIAFSASFGINELPESKKEKYNKYISKFHAISVREDKGKEIIEKLTKRKDVVTLLDPTMLIEASNWDKVCKKPKIFDDVIPNGKKYIFNYFLGGMNEEEKKEIERFAKENDCRIINILDSSDPFYTYGPAEFLWLEKNAFLICTDSFHSTVFSILFKNPFITFERKKRKNDKEFINMYSRIETLLTKFGFEDRKFSGKITNNVLKCNFNHVDKILYEERKKATDFLEKALDMEGNNNE